ncbi:MAG: hypothetical protein H5T59_14330 [Anaerolineae bacterium]|nr:hypothetical protein [Anaerolineae bacterium]
MKRRTFLLACALAVWLALAPLALAQDGGPEAATEVSVALALAPLVAAATGIEQLLEWFFNWLESLYQGLVVAALGGVLGWYRWARDKWQAAYEGLQQAAAELRRLRGEEAPDEERIREWVRKSRQFEARLLAAQTRLQGVTKMPQYVRLKQGVALLAGLALGVVLALQADLRMFHMLGFSLAPGLEVWDRLITGLVTGTGSQPVHSLVKLLHQSQDALGRLRDMWQRRGEFWKATALGENAPPPVVAAELTGKMLPSPEYTLVMKQGL